MTHATVKRGLGAPTLLRFAALAAFLAAIVAALGMSAQGAKAETVGFSFDRGVINLGGEEEGLWAKIIDPDLSPPDPEATVNAEVAGDGSLTAGTDDFYFPPKRLEDIETGLGAMPLVDAQIAITADGPLTGNHDDATGETLINLPADVFITVYGANSPVSIAKCRVDGFTLGLETTGDISDPGDPAADPPRPAADYDASPFAPPNGDGAVIAPWESLPASSPEGGSLAGTICPLLDGMIGGPGAIWMAGETGGEIITPLPTLAPKLTVKPVASTEQTTANFAFETEAGETSPVTGFKCKLDAGAFEACNEGTKSYTGLSVGSHTFEVKSSNAAGEGPVASYDWQVTEAPDECPPGTTGTPPNCVAPGKAKLGGLKISPKMKSVKRGKSATITVKVKNAGDAAANGVKVCVTAPKALVKVKKCANVGQVGAGKTKNAKFKVSVKKKAKKGKKAALRFKATSSNAGSKTGKATVKVK